MPYFDYFWTITVPTFCKDHTKTQFDKFYRYTFSVSVYIQHSYLYWLLFCCIECNLISSLVSKLVQHFAKIRPPLHRLLKTTEHNSHEPIRSAGSAKGGRLDLCLQVHRKIDNCVYLRCSFLSSTTLISQIFCLNPRKNKQSISIPFF